MPRDIDHQAVLELNRRREMEIASEKLLAALREEHPRIIAHLTRKRQPEQPEQPDPVEPRWVRRIR